MQNTCAFIHSAISFTVNRRNSGELHVTRRHVLDGQWLAVYVLWHKVSLSWKRNLFGAQMLDLVTVWNHFLGPHAFLSHRNTNVLSFSALSLSVQHDFSHQTYLMHIITNYKERNGIHCRPNKEPTMLTLNIEVNICTNPFECHLVNKILGNNQRPLCVKAFASIPGISNPSLHGTL